MSNSETTKITVVIGTVRPGNYTQKAAAVVVDTLTELEDVTLQVLNLANFTLNMPGGSDAKGTEDAKKIKSMLQASDGVMICTPEYNGSFPAALKLMIENLGFPSALSQKSVAMVGVAAGKIGAIKSLEHLRSVLCHTGAITLSRVVSIPEIDKVFTKEGKCLDESMKNRIGQLTIDLYKHAKCSCPCSAHDEEEQARR
ncbi:MAG: NAD(P)H-dependent oxidoreductase [Leptospirales bacterium]